MKDEKKYLKPEAEIIEFSETDIIVTSNPEPEVSNPGGIPLI